MRSLLLPLFLVTALLFVQQGAYAHALTHLQQPQQDHTLPHDSGCEQCAGYAGLDHTPTSHTQSSPIETAHDALTPTPALRHRAALPQRKTARAPPSA